jgi:hypothetical protein
MWEHLPTAPSVLSQVTSRAQPGPKLLDLRDQTANSMSNMSRRRYPYSIFMNIPTGYYLPCRPIIDKLQYKPLNKSGLGLKTTEKTMRWGGVMQHRAKKRRPSEKEASDLRESRSRSQNILDFYSRLAIGSDIFGSSVVPNDHNEPNKHLLSFIFFRKIVRLATIYP